jgi:hypothetical protein
MQITPTNKTRYIKQVNNQRANVLIVRARCTSKLSTHPMQKVHEAMAHLDWPYLWHMAQDLTHYFIGYLDDNTFR